MVNWGEIRGNGKARFVLLFGTVLSIPLVLDYYIIKFFINSFQLNFSFIELLIAWITFILLGFLFGIYGWKRMEKDWLKNKSEL
jgi:hypothetical protein